MLRHFVQLLKLEPVTSSASRAMPPKHALLTQIDWDPNPSRPVFQHPVRGDCYFAWSTIVSATSPSQIDHIMATYNNVSPFIRYESDGIFVHVQSYALREILVTYLERGQEPSGLESTDES